MVVLTPPPSLSLTLETPPLYHLDRQQQENKKQKSGRLYCVTLPPPPPSPTFDTPALGYLDRQYKNAKTTPIG